MKNDEKLNASVKGYHAIGVVGQGLVLVLLTVAVLAFITFPVLARRWMELPFVGGFIEQTMSFNNASSLENPSRWSAHNEGLRFGDRLLVLDGNPIQSSRALEAVLTKSEIGEVISATVQTAAGETKQYELSLIRLPELDRWAYFYLPYLIGLVYLACGGWIFAMRRNLSVGRSFAVFSISTAVAVGGLFDLYTTHRLTYLWTLAVPLLGAALIDLAFIFPSEDPIVSRRQYFRYVGYGLAGALFVNAVPKVFDITRPFGYSPAWRLAYLFSGMALLFTLGWLSMRKLKIASSIEREQIRLMLVGAALSFIPLAIWMIVYPLSSKKVAFSPYLMLPLVIFPLVAAFAVQRYRIFRADYFFSRAFLYGLMMILVVAGYALFVAGMGVVLKDVISEGSPLVIGGIIFILALLFNPVRERLEKMMDEIFFQGERAYQLRLQTFSGDLAKVVDVPGIIELLRNYIKHSISPERFHIYVYDPLSEQYIAFADESGKLTSDIQFGRTSPLVNTLEERNAPLALTSFTSIPVELQKEKNRLEILGTNIFVPLPGNQRLAGWIALGKRLSGQEYSTSELAFLDKLGDQAALAIERAQVVANMEQRVQEMNILSRIAQGINITLSLNDILELISAQTNNLIPADDFHILLKDQETGLLEWIFYVEDDERYEARENVPLGEDTYLEGVVLAEGHSLITDDLVRTYSARGLVPPGSGVYAWMCVPLNAGAGTIGALSLGRRDASAIFNNEQLGLLQSIADQAAGAIVKARLLEETERRARQLATLNEMTRQLSSTLELEPLLQNILQSAVDILNCEAGSLLLLDEEGDELVFRVAVGPVAEQLINRRMPSNSGVVGQSVQNRIPVIVNDTSESEKWFADTDKETGFNSRSLLVVPLLVKDLLLGVIEVVNRKDGLPFIRDDQNLLMAFASQAAVAIENARLYTMTDQALASRVEELSVMQRIDRDLNASLETGRAMRITLDWALRQSGVEAGFLGLVREGGLELKEVYGYGNELEPFERALVSLEQYEFRQVVEEGMPRWKVSENGNQVFFLTGAREQLVFPIRRESATMGLLVLESRSDGRLTSEETMNFLARLSDRASIAISNAQLYDEVQRANDAKSDFVSFVSHELKNPMTSIKGYTELLAAGAVGPITEPQKNFLNTIRSNVERMTILVSDLNDVSKIEAGRLRFDYATVNITEIVEEVLRSLRRMLEEKHQEIVVELSSDLPLAWADKGRLVQIVTNFISNSCKYTPEGGKLIVSAEADENHWDPEGARKVLHFWVKDNGIGISEEDQKKIFTKFFRSEDPKTREAPGTGLGLNITKSLVEAQGGRIWFESVFREGTTFHFTIPVAD